MIFKPGRPGLDLFLHSRQGNANGEICGLCCKKNTLWHKDIERHFSSVGNLEEIGHKSYLSVNVAFPDSFTG